MRRLIILLTLIIALVAMFRLNRLSREWHYIVPAAPGDLIYVTTFDDNASGDWTEYPANQMSSQVTDGVMRITVNDPGRGLYSEASPYFRNFDVQVHARVKGGVFDGTNNNGYGILFRQYDRANYYIFLVSSDGSYRVKRVSENREQFLSDWIFTDAIHTELGMMNVLRVVGDQDRFQFYINGTLMQLCIPNNIDTISTMFNGVCLDGSLQDTLVDDSVPFGRIGVAVELDRDQTTSVVVDFDNILIYGPHPIPGK